MRKAHDSPLFLLDANACNALQKSCELNELETLARAGVIDLLYTETTWDEAQFGSRRRGVKASEFFFLGLPNDHENLAIQNPWRTAIAQVVFPTGVTSENQRRDVEALLTVKLSGGCFVTRDGASKTQPGGILGHKPQLAQLGIEVLNFTEALARARSAA